MRFVAVLLASLIAFSPVDDFQGNRSQQSQFCVMSLGAGLLLKTALTASRI